MIPLLLCLATLGGADDSLSRDIELGPVHVTTTLTPREPTIGDEVVLEIVVTAAAGVDVLMPEFGEALSRYTILDFVPKQRVADDGSTVHRQRYTLQPYLSGEQAIPPILIEFVDHRPGQKPAPDDLDAYELLTERLDFQVKSSLPDSASRELNPPLGKLELVTTFTQSATHTLVVGAIITLAAAVAGFLFWRSRRRRVLRRNAYEIARARLDLLLAHTMPEGEAGIEGFFVEISAIIRRYLEDRFDLRAPELTTEEFLGVAGSSGALSGAHQGLLRDFLRQADLVKFAGIQASEQDIRRSTDLAVQFLEETRENAPLITVADPTTGKPSVIRNSLAASTPASSSVSKEQTDVGA